MYWFLWPLRLVWLLVCCLYKEVYLQIFKCVSFWLHGCCWEWEGGPVNQVNHTSWVAVVTPTDRPKSVRNCCLIELFCSVVCVVTLPFWHFCWCRGFCHRTGSDLLLFVWLIMCLGIYDLSEPFRGYSVLILVLSYCYPEFLQPQPELADNWKEHSQFQWMSFYVFILYFYL